MRRLITSPRPWSKAKLDYRTGKGRWGGVSALRRREVSRWPKRTVSRPRNGGFGADQKGRLSTIGGSWRPREKGTPREYRGGIGSQKRGKRAVESLYGTISPTEEKKAKSVVSGQKRDELGRERQKKKAQSLSARDGTERRSGRKKYRPIMKIGHICKERREASLRWGREKEYQSG